MDVSGIRHVRAVSRKLEMRGEPLPDDFLVPVFSGALGKICGEIMDK